MKIKYFVLNYKILGLTKISHDVWIPTKSCVKAILRFSKWQQKNAWELYFGFKLHGLWRFPIKILSSQSDQLTVGLGDVIQCHELDPKNSSSCEYQVNQISHWSCILKLHSYRTSAPSRRPSPSRVCGALPCIPSEPQNLD